ncbi:MAG: SGNH/GDSL hydrolase family protein, partial [Planctomycetes bacterium]|nr:SGNH/GDSL hydrolase family protein [Planctomycetota bacterium]
MIRFPLLLALAFLTFAAPILKADGVVELKKGDRIVFIGGTLAAREQYFGHVEAMLHATFPKLELTVRNQGFTADEVRFRPRSLNFGEPDKHLTLARADVILAFFGFAESFDGPEGLATFEKELRDFIAHTKSQNYSGKGAPRLVLFSPIAHEDLRSPNLPDGSKTNPNLELYTKAMAGICEKTATPFVDLYHPTLQMYRREPRERGQGPYTFNGIHLTGAGYSRLAPVIVESLTGETAPEKAVSRSLMREIEEKNFQYFHRYRAVNGFYIYGGRSERPNGNPPFTDKYVLENERAKLDEMCAVV